MSHREHSDHIYRHDRGHEDRRDRPNFFEQREEYFERHPTLVDDPHTEGIMHDYYTKDKEVFCQIWGEDTYRELSGESDDDDLFDDDELEDEEESEFYDEDEDLSDSLPYTGMSADLIDETYLGAHDDEGDIVEGGSKEGSFPYYWLAYNGEDRIFTAYVDIDTNRVVGTFRNNTDKDYWYDESSGEVLDLPNLDGEGERAEDDEDVPLRLESPSKYDDPGDFADANEDYFEAQGYDDPWDEAYTYWNDKMDS